MFCGLCGKRMAVEQNGVGRIMYRCRAHGQGCDQPRRTNKGLHLAARLGLRLLAQDRDLQAAIREELRRTGRTGQGTGRRAGAAPPERLAALSERRRKLLELCYADRISAEGFAEEEARIAAGHRICSSGSRRGQGAVHERDELLQRFEEVAALLQDLDLDTAWDEATESERRILVEELVEKVAVFPDHLEVTIVGAPRLNVGLTEVGLGGGQSENVGVGGPTCTISYYRPLAPKPVRTRACSSRSRARCRRAYDLIIKDQGLPAQAESASDLVAKNQRAYRELSVQGDVHMRLARLHGTLRRASEQGDCDFLVEGSHGHFIRVRLVAEHLVGPPDGPVVLDSRGKPFANDGDDVLCVGGSIPASNVEGGRSVFVAGRLACSSEVGLPRARRADGDV